MDTTSSPRMHVWLLAAVAVGGAFYLTGKNMELRAPVTSPFTINVSADAKVSAPPDIAALSFGVTTGRQTTAKAAIDNIKKNMDAVLAAVKAAGIPDKDISTQSFYLNPVYDYTNGTQVPRGYEATQSLNVKVRDLDNVGAVLSAATAAGANQVGSISFSIDNPDSVQAQARQMAIQKAKAKAQTLASSLGLSLGRMTGFTEGGGAVTPPMPMMMKSEAYGGVANQDSLSIPTGEQDVTSYVTITYELR